MSPSAPVIEQRAVAPMMKNGYLVACPDTGDAAYIDPGDEADEMLALIAENGLRLNKILITHAHMDHICGNARVKESWDVPIYLHPDDEMLYVALKKQGEWFGFNYEPPPQVDRYLEAGQCLKIGQLDVLVHHTPGHSPGSVSFDIGHHLFCGDLIFAGSVGRTDLPGGAPQLLLRTIREKVLPLGEDKILHPGHGPATTIGRERLTNPFLNGEL
jgi:glyoxylase-like metal-dependent hydrolase (beta-lactamase superfamily II)